MSSGVIFETMQFLNKQGFTETARKLGQESRLYLDMKYVEEKVLDGNWDEVENYLSGFTKVDDNEHSAKIFFYIHKGKYLEAFDKPENEREEAVQVLVKDMKIYASDGEISKEIRQLLKVTNFREYEKLVLSFKDIDSVREDLRVDLKRSITENPLLGGKLQFPILRESRLKNVADISLADPQPQTLLADPPDVEPQGPLAPSLFASPPQAPSSSSVMPASSSRQNKGNNWVIKRSDAVEISEPARYCSLKLQGYSFTKIISLVYTNSGASLLALASDAVHRLWKWPSGEATVRAPPNLWQPTGAGPMTNDFEMNNNVVHCFALHKDDVKLLSSSGGKITVFDIRTFKDMHTFKPSLVETTYIAFHPLDSNIVAIGLKDSSIVIFQVQNGVRISTLLGHSQSITGLAFSNSLSVLVSCDCDAQICVWHTEEWKKDKDVKLEKPKKRKLKIRISDTVKFHQDQTRFLVVHETQICICDASKLENRVTRMLSSNWEERITHATFSCDSHMIYATFMDASVWILDSSNLTVIRQILLSALLPDISTHVCPLVIAAHPSKPNQFALGLTNGSVHVLEPEESGGT